MLDDFHDPEKRALGIKLRLRQNIDWPQGNHCVSNDPGQWGGIFSDIDVAAAEAAEASARHQDLVFQAQPHIKKAAEIFYAAARDNPRQMVRLYNLLNKGTDASPAERQEAQGIVREIIGKRLVDPTLNSQKEEQALVSPPAVQSRRKFLRNLSAGVAGVAALGTLASGAGLMREAMRDRAEESHPLPYAAGAAVGALATVVGGFATSFFHDEYKQEEVEAGRAAERTKWEAEDACSQALVDQMVFAAAHALYQLEDQGVQVALPENRLRLR